LRHRCPCWLYWLLLPLRLVLPLPLLLLDHPPFLYVALSWGWATR
jgi:hypothetical protein